MRSRKAGAGNLAEGYTWQQEYACGTPKAPLAKAQSGKKNRNQRDIQARCHHHGDDGIQLRHAGATAARAGVLEQGPQDLRCPTNVSIRRRKPSFSTPAASPSSSGTEPRQNGAARQTDYFEADREMPNNGTLTMESGPAVQRWVSEKRLQLRNNINTVDGGTHLTDPLRADRPSTRSASRRGAKRREQPRETSKGPDTTCRSSEESSPSLERQTKGKSEQRICTGLHDADDSLVNDKLGEYFDKTPIRRRTQAVGRPIEADRPREAPGRDRARDLNAADPSTGRPSRHARYCTGRSRSESWSRHGYSWWRANRARRTAKQAANEISGHLPLRARSSRGEGRATDKMLAHEESLHDHGPGHGHRQRRFTWPKLGATAKSSSCPTRTWTGSHIRTLR